MLPAMRRNRRIFQRRFHGVHLLPGGFAFRFRFGKKKKFIGYDYDYGYYAGYEYEPKFIGSENNDCIHITDDDIDEVKGLGGNDVIVIEGDRAYKVRGDGAPDYYNYERQSDGNDTITIVGSNTGEVYGGGGADVIKITGNNPRAYIYGGSGNDYCEGAINYRDCEAYGL